ncbi:hypothetical protein JCM10207_002656 [Rhodosporidiobolus poonsookiae]
MAQGNIASNDLLWLLTRTHSAHLHKIPGSGARSFSNERGNLLGLSSARYSGLAQSKTVDIAPAKEGGGVTVEWREAGALPFAVKSAIKTKDLTKDNYKRELLDVLAEAQRDDLYQVACRRAEAIFKVQGRSNK